MQRGWTQEFLAGKLQLAGLTHMDRVLLAKIESNIRSVYDYELVSIAAALQAPLEELFPKFSTLKKALPNLIGSKGNQ